MSLFQNKYRIETTRYPHWDYRRAGWYFVTVATRHHLCAFGQITNGVVTLSSAGAIADEDLKEVPRHYIDISIDRFVVMPNHLHMIVVIGGDHVYSPDSQLHAARTADRNSALIPPMAGSLSAIVRSYKAGVTRRCHELGINFAWQSGFHEHIVRTNLSLNAIRDYIENNPANWTQDDQNPES